MRKDKNIAFELRKQGKSYREIQKEIGVSRSTLCDWFKNVAWSKHNKNININRNIKLSTERLEKLNTARTANLVHYYEEALLEAGDLYHRFRQEPLFTAGLMIYAGEGDKLNKGLIRMANADPSIHKVFLHFSEKYLGFKRENLKFSLLCYPDHDVDAVKMFWVNTLGIFASNFHKIIVIQGRHPTKRLQYGVLSSIIASTVKKKVILKWIELFCSDQEYAGMV